VKPRFFLGRAFVATLTSERSNWREAEIQNLWTDASQVDNVEFRSL